MLHVWNPRGGWWGEGDEKFFVDGEKFPSTIGTGSEDYFGYAWCSPQLFQNAYHNQTRNDGNNRGHVSVNRWHIADNVPFQKSFEGCIEKYYPNDRPTLYAAHGLLVSGAGRQRPLRAGAAERARRLLDAGRDLQGQGRDRGREAEDPGQDRRRTAGAGHDRLRRARGATTRTSGGPAPSRATSSSWPCR